MLAAAVVKYSARRPDFVPDSRKSLGGAAPESKWRDRIFSQFHDNSAYWCTDVSDELMRRFFLKLANERNRRRRAAKQYFKN
jgi:hypothetical protein